VAHETSCGLKKQSKSLGLKQQTGRMLYKTLVRPILTYGSECWPLSVMEMCSESLREESYEWYMALLTKMMYGEQGIITLYAVWWIRQSDKIRKLEVPGRPL
jgi:hypothetical protein